MLDSLIFTASYSQLNQRMILFISFYTNTYLHTPANHETDFSEYLPQRQQLQEEGVRGPLGFRFMRKRAQSLTYEVVGASQVVVPHRHLQGLVGQLRQGDLIEKLLR